MHDAAHLHLQCTRTPDQVLLHRFGTHLPVPHDPLGLLHCSISHTTPDMHCHKVERVTQVIDNKAVAVLAGLPYRLSPTLILHLKAFIANQLNHTAQSTLHTAVTPYWSFYKAKPVLNKDPAKAFLPFGAMVMIKRRSLPRSP